jgi:hypothetical protein
MRVLGISSIFLLTACILSSGLAGAFAAEGSQQVPLSVETNYPGYSDGTELIISGQVRDSSLASQPTPVLLRIITPDGSNMVGMEQVMLDSDNRYSVSLTAGGPLWTASGEYTIKAQYGAQKGETTFTFTGDAVATPEPVVVEEPEPVVVEEPEPVVVEEPVVVVQPEPEPEPEPEPMCGAGTVLEDGKCVAEEKGGGCLIATAAYGSEMAPQVQFLREIRDGKIMATESGTAFMTGFNQFYYSFSPAVADYERENPMFKEAVKVTLTPLLTSLAILNYVDIDTEQEMLGYGIGVILLNIGMYFVAPAAVIIAIKNRRK